MTDINNIKTICSFYASDWHLVTMLLPNIDKKINKGIKITTILEKDLNKSMEILLKKLNIENKEKILNIDWNKEDCKNIQTKVENNDCIIVCGTKEYIDKAHELIKDSINKEKRITIIDCYNIDECELEVKEILEEHDIILNTSGEKDKGEYITTIKI